MPKSRVKAASPIDLLVTKVAPASVIVTRRKRICASSKYDYELSYVTRGCINGVHGSSVEDAAKEALLGLDAPDDDPRVPAWPRLTRFQREVVENVLREHAAKHMARAASAKVAGSPRAFAEYEIADAFHAALGALFCDDITAVEDREKELLEAERPRPRPSGSTH